MSSEIAAEYGVDAGRVCDLNHAIVNRDCRDADLIELWKRLEYDERSGDGRLDINY